MKICILTAGRGTRMGPVDKIINKALLPIQDKAIISHIVDFFPNDAEFVIGLGHLKDQVVDYLSVAHPNIKVDYVTVDNIDGPGSGSGYSLLCCKDHLQEPFIFLPSDGLLFGDLKSVPENNWIGTKFVDSSLSVQYCNAKVKDGKVQEIQDKQKCDNSFVAWSGLAYVKDYDVFWNNLGNSKIIAGEHQISNGLQGLLQHSSLHAVEVNWIDLGDWKKYSEQRKKETPYDFSKIEEAIYFVNNKVIKFFADQKYVSARLEKTKIKPKIFPNVTKDGENFYSYPFSNGKTLYEHCTPKLFQNLLSWMNDNVWTHEDIPQNDMKSLCMEFYFHKTQNRLELFKHKNPNYVFPKFVNGKKLTNPFELINNLPWNDITDGYASFIHGDLNFDNILFEEESNNFVLIDWRQDFAGQINFGDIYYDLAKLYGGILINYDCIKKGLFKYEIQQNDCFIDYARRISFDSYSKILEDFVKRKNLDWKKTKLISAISFLNMAPLHHEPYNFLLMSLGTELINNELN
jgi:NDP-sugar pyrophosphorylase family protein